MSVTAWWLSSFDKAAMEGGRVEGWAAETPAVGSVVDAGEEVVREVVAREAVVKEEEGAEDTSEATSGKVD